MSDQDSSAAIRGSTLTDGLGSWVPVVERMPPSGAVVLVAYRNERGEWRRIRAQWIAAKSVEAGCDSEIGEYEEATDTYYDPEGWYESINNWDDYSAVMVYEGLTIALDAAACPADKRLTFELSGAARYSVTTPLERPVSRLVGDGHGL